MTLTIIQDWLVREHILCFGHLLYCDLMWNHFTLHTGNLLNVVTCVCMISRELLSVIFSIKKHEEGENEDDEGKNDEEEEEEEEEEELQEEDECKCLL